MHLRIARAVYTMHPEGFEDRSYVSPYLLSTFVQSYASCVHLDASKLNTVNLSKRCVQLGAIRLHLKMHAMVARKLRRVDAALEASNVTHVVNVQ